MSRPARIALTTVQVVLIGAIVLHLVGGWIYASVLHDRLLDAGKRRAAGEPDYDVTVLAVTSDEMTLKPNGDELLSREGTFGVAWPEGYGQLTDVLASDAKAITRRFTLLDGLPPESGTKVDLDPRAYATPAELGLAYEDVRIAGSLGDHPAWFVPGVGDTWAIVVHGNDLNRADGLRLLGVTSSLGLPGLVVSTRNAPGAPGDPSGRVAYGTKEWRDLDAAVAYALENGAEDVILLGQDLGGATVLSFLDQSERADRIKGVVLEAPTADLEQVFDQEGDQERFLGLPLPPTMTAMAKGIAALRFDLDWDELDYVAEAPDREPPMLVLHGTDDDEVPISVSRQLAAARPDRISLSEMSGAGHLTSWNLERDRVEQEVRDFVSSLPQALP